MSDDKCPKFGSEGANMPGKMIRFEDVDWVVVEDLGRQAGFRAMLIRVGDQNRVVIRHGDGWRLWDFRDRIGLAPSGAWIRADGTGD